MKKFCVVATVVAFLGSMMSLTSAEAADAPTRGVIADPASSVAYGRTVDAVSGRPVPFVLVIAYDELYSTPIGATISGLRGRFVVRGLTGEEFALRYIGRLTRHESGWQACDGNVVPTTGLACTQAPGDQGQISLDRR